MSAFAYYAELVLALYFLSGILLFMHFACQFVNTNEFEDILLPVAGDFQSSDSTRENRTGNRSVKKKTTRIGEPDLPKTKNTGSESSSALVSVNSNTSLKKTGQSSTSVVREVRSESQQSQIMLKEASETLKEASRTLREASESLKEGTESLKEVSETLKEGSNKLGKSNSSTDQSKTSAVRVESASQTRSDVVEIAEKSKTSTVKTSELVNEEDKNEEFVEGVVCKESDISENSMKVVSLGPDEHKVLLVKQNGQICAMGTKCSHYGAPLVTGALGNGRVRCPWHGACFNIKTGDIEDFPGLDSVPVYNVVIDNGDVKVRAKKEDLKSQKRMKHMASCDPSEGGTYVIVGGGPAGQICAETLRQEGFSGKLTMVTADENKPYDRIKLSKSLDVTIEKIQLRPDAFYKEHDIEVISGRKAIKLDTSGKSLELDNGQTLKYNSLFLATGSTPRKLDIPGIDLENIFTLRTLEDSTKIFKSLNPSSHVVVFGSSFIGMEAAAFCVGKVASVTVVGMSKAPFAEAFGEELGARIGRVFTEKGVKLLMQRTIKAFKGEGQVKEAEISDGEVIPADVVVVGLGVAFCTDFLKESGLTLTSRGAVPVNQFLETNVSGVYAGGDIAEAPVFAVGDKPFAIGHWGLAHYHGRIAALNMLSKSTPLKSVPFFWTMLFGTSYRYAGVGIEADEKITVGDIDALKGAVYYCQGDKIIAVATVGVDPLAAEYAELLANGGSLSKKLALEEPLTWYKKK